jgi:hypothetical protein
MSTVADHANFPTMIIPKGTEIRINAQGQLSIKTPGNLVIQNSGNYSELESTNGSIRIEENVHVEAISVKAAQACFIQGTLTAWRVHAKKIALEDRAKANIMLQESEQLELSKTSRLVGNFANEKEIYLLLAKFSPQLKQLPSNMDIHATTPEITAVADQTHPHSLPQSAGTGTPSQAAPAATNVTASRAAALPESLTHALHLLERETERPDLESRAVESLREVVFALREHDLQRVQLIYREAFTEITSPSDAVRAAYNFIDGYFQRSR